MGEKLSTNSQIFAVKFFLRFSSSTARREKGEGRSILVSKTYKIWVNSFGGSKDINPFWGHGKNHKCEVLFFMRNTFDLL